MTGRTSFETDIRPLFTERDIRAMSKAFNLASHDDVKTHSAKIYDRRFSAGHRPQSSLRKLDPCVRSRSPRDDLGWDH